MCKWSDFYKVRDFDRYDIHFRKKYGKFIDFAEKQAYKGDNHVYELGCGIGSLSRVLRGKGIACNGIDISSDMVSLANANVGENLFSVGDIKEEFWGGFGASHGVLEHFSDFDILQVLKMNPWSLHYVPLDKYEKPSFGDERLLPYQYWVDLVEPEYYEVFNDGHDMIFLIDKR